MSSDKHNVNWEPWENVHEFVRGDEASSPPLGLFGKCCGMPGWHGYPDMVILASAGCLAHFFFSALIQITQQPLCFAMIKRYSPHGKMCCSKLCVAPVANLIYTMGNRKAFFIWLNSRHWHEIAFLISTCWKCYDNTNTFFSLLGKQKKRKEKKKNWKQKANQHFLISCITARAFFDVLWV